MWRVLIAYRHHKSDLFCASEQAGRYVGAVGVIAEIFREVLFIPVWSLDARFDCYLRNCSPLPVATLFMAGRLCASEFSVAAGAWSLGQQEVQREL